MNNSKKTLRKGLRHPLINIALALYSMASLILLDYWYLRLSSIIFVPFAIASAHYFYEQQPPIIHNKGAGIINILMSVIIFISLTEELLNSQDPFFIRSIVTTCVATAISILLIVGSKQLESPYEETY